MMGSCLRARARAMLRPIDQAVTRVLDTVGRRWVEWEMGDGI